MRGAMRCGKLAELASKHRVRFGLLCQLRARLGMSVEKRRQCRKRGAFGHRAGVTAKPRGEPRYEAHKSLDELSPCGDLAGRGEVVDHRHGFTSSAAHLPVRSAPLMDA